MIKNVCVFFIVMTTLGLDRWTKHLALLHLGESPEGISVTPFFNLILVWNKGISFGMFSQHDQPIALAIMALTISLGLVFWLLKEPSAYVKYSLALIIGGAVGNSIDRFHYGAVVDFLDFHAFGYHWPAFNVADSAIFIGVVLLCIQTMLWPSHDHPKGSA